MMLSTRLAASLLLAVLAAPALAQDLPYELVNDSGLTLMEFYASAAGEGGGGDDILGANVLATGETGQVVLADGSAQCDHDFRFVFEDGSERVVTVNACDAASYTIVP